MHAKVDGAYQRVLDILQEQEREWNLTALLREVNYTLDLEDMVSMATLRRAARRLPSACYHRRHGQIVISTRCFARPDEVIAAIHALPTFDYDLPILLTEAHKQAIRRTLALDRRLGLHNSLVWASAQGVRFAIDYTFYGTTVRFNSRKAA